MASGINAVVGDIILLTLEGQLCGQTVMNTCTYVVGNVSPGNDTDDVGSDLVAFWQSGAPSPQTKYLNLLPDNYDLIRYRTQFIWPTRIRAVKTPVNTPGLNGVDSVGANQAAYIERNGALGSRDQISGFHIPYPNLEGVGEVGLVTTAYLSAMATLATVLKTIITGAGTGARLDPCIYHRGKTPYYSLAIEAAPYNEIRTMRRRTVGRGI